MLMLNRFICLLLFLHLIIFQAIPVTAQSALLFPIKPGIPNTLAGTMGELRSSHFHTGIDVRTGGQEGLQVLAADDGYVSRIAVNPGGYGNAIYIKHPNGHTTVYAHLKLFPPEIEAYVNRQQYAKKTFKIQLYPNAQQFILEQGDFSAFLTLYYLSPIYLEMNATASSLLESQQSALYSGWTNGDFSDEYITDRIEALSVLLARNNADAVDATALSSIDVATGLSF